MPLASIGFQVVISPTPAMEMGEHLVSKARRKTWHPKRTCQTDSSRLAGRANIKWRKCNRNLMLEVLDKWRNQISRGTIVRNLRAISHQLHIWTSSLLGFLPRCFKFNHVNLPAASSPSWDSNCSFSLLNSIPIVVWQTCCIPHLLDI